MGAIGKDTVRDDLAQDGGAAWPTGALSGARRLEPVPPSARLRTDDAATLRKERNCRGQPRSLRSGFILTPIAARPCRAPRCTSEAPSAPQDWQISSIIVSESQVATV